MRKSDRLSLRTTRLFRLLSVLQTRDSNAQNTALAIPLLFRTYGRFSAIFLSCPLSNPGDRPGRSDFFLKEVRKESTEAPGKQVDF